MHLLFMIGCSFIVGLMVGIAMPLWWISAGVNIVAVALNVRALLEEI
jgi:hypothetical protein